MFSTSGMFGFASKLEDEVFFHAQDFHRMEAGGPLPILGERVEVGEITDTSGRRPQAVFVQRAHPQPRITGVVRSYDSKKGWGFVEYSGGQAFLHASETIVGWLPVIGTAVEFYEGRKKGKARACWARPAGFAGTVSF